MRVVESQTRDAIEYLWNGRRNKPIPISEWARAVFGHATPSLQRKMVQGISRFRDFAESRGFGLLCSVKEQHGNLSRVTHVLLAEEGANVKYVARELMARKARQLGFQRSFARGLDIILERKMLPAATVEDVESRRMRAKFLPAAEQQKMLQETTERINKKKNPQFGKAVKIAAQPKK